MMDDKDRRLLTLIQQDAKKPNKVFAAELGISVTAVFERIRKLERQGVIRGYAALVDREKVQKNFTVLCQVKLVQHKKEYITRFETEIQNFPEVLECYHVSGNFDYLLKICVKDIDEYRSFMVSKLTTMQHIASTTSSFSIKEVKCSTVVEVG